MLTKTLRSLWTETSPEKVIARAHKYLEKGRSDTAAGVLRDALEEGGEEPAIRMELSRILITMNQVREACNGLKKFLKAHPDQAHQVQELLAWAKANHQEARSLNEVLAEHHVSRRDFRAGYDALENLGKEALQVLLDARLANLNRFLEKKPDAVPRSALPLIYLTALIHEAMGEDPRAVEVYQRIVSAYPKEISGIDERLNAIKARHFRSTSLRGALAAIYSAAGDTNRAAQEMVEMVEIDPQLAPKAAETLKDLAGQAESPAKIRMGIVRLFKIARDTEGLVGAARDLLAGGGAEAEELLTLLEEVLLEGKSDPRLLLVIGETASAAGRLSRAVSAFSGACQEAPEDVRVRALGMMQRLFAEHPEETKIAEVLADQSIREGRLDDAVGLLSRLPLTPQDAPAIASRLQSILISSPTHAAAMELLEKVSPQLNDPHLAVLFIRRRLREGPESARAVVEPIAQLLAKTPHDALVRMAAVEARAASGDMARAWEDLRPLLDGTAGPDPALLHLVVLVGGSSPELEREVAQGFRSMAPALAETPEGQFCLGEMAARAGDLPAALDAFRVAASFSPEAAREAVSAARDLCGDLRSGEAAASLADLLLDVGDFGGAASLLGSMEGLGVAAGPLIQKIEGAYKKDPDRAELRLALAAALAASGRAGHARKLIDEGIQRAGAAAPGTLHLAAGDAWLRDGNLGDAVRSYSRAMAQDKSLAGETVRRLDRVLATDVGHAGGHLARGRGLLLDGNPREGVNALLTAWSIKPSLGSTILKDLDYAARAFPLEPSVDLARAQITMGQGEVEAATAALGAALNTSPTMAPEVLSRLQAIIRSHPSCAPARLHAARAWRLRGRFREAGEEYLAALELEPKLIDHVAPGLAELESSFPAEPAVHLARARMEETRGNPMMAAEAYEAAACLGAEPAEACGALEKLAEKKGPHGGRALLALARARRHAGEAAAAAAAIEKAAHTAPERMEEVLAEADDLVEQCPAEASARIVRSRILTAGPEPARAVPDLERALDLDPGLWQEVAGTAAEIAAGGGDTGRVRMLRARALLAGGDLETASEVLDRLAKREQGDAKARALVLRARVDRRRGNLEAARQRLDEAAALAPNRNVFLTALHGETRDAAVLASRMRGSAAERWRALSALIDLGDVEAAEGLAREMGLTADGAGGEGTGEGRPAHEALARIACLKGCYGVGVRLLEKATPSPLKSHVLRRAGRLVEAAACLERAGAPAAAPALPSREIYVKLAAKEFLGEPGCLEAETFVNFSAGHGDPDDTAEGGTC